jgi:hypothetical protein
MFFARLKKLKRLREKVRISERLLHRLERKKQLKKMFPDYWTM